MEVFCAQPDTPHDVCMREIERCTHFVGIYAHRYGSIPDGEESSLIELEFNRAEQKNLPIFAFLLDSSYEWPEEFIENEPGRTKLQEFKSRIDSTVTRETFTTQDNLAMKAATSIIRYLNTDVEEIQTTRTEDEESLVEFETGSISDQQIAEVNRFLMRILGKYTKQPILERMKARFGGYRAKRDFFVEKFYEKFIRSFLEACTINLDSDSLQISRRRLDVLAARAFGILALMAINRDSRNIESIKIELEMDKSRIMSGWPRGNEFQKDMFFEWLREFTNIEMKHYDEDLYDLMWESDYSSQIQWLRDNQIDINQGLQRMNELANLFLEMLQKRQEILSNESESLSNLWILVLELFYRGW